MNQVTANPPSSLPSIIERAASDPTFDLDKLQRLLDMQEAYDLRTAENAFIAAHAAAEAEMETINTDANNPQTRSRYATFAQVDRAARPIYTKHGFGISFTSEPMSTPDSLLVVGMLSHRLGHSRRFQLPVPIVTRGIQGKEMMNAIHATMTAVSYGKRNLEILMFNLAIGEDDDGNRAGGGVGRRPPPPAGDPAANYGGGGGGLQSMQRPPQKPFKPFELIDHGTGEVIIKPTLIPRAGADKQSLRAWGEQLVGALNNLATSTEEIDEWLQFNVGTTEVMEKNEPEMFEKLLTAIKYAKDRFK